MINLKFNFVLTVNYGLATLELGSALALYAPVYRYCVPSTISLSALVEPKEKTPSSV